MRPCATPPAHLITPEELEQLRDVYFGLRELPRLLSFEQAIASDAIRIGLWNTAQARHKKHLAAAAAAPEHFELTA